MATASMLNSTKVLIRVMGYIAQRNALHERYAKAMNDSDLNELKQIIIDEELLVPLVVLKIGRTYANST